MTEIFKPHTIDITFMAPKDEPKKNRRHAGGFHELFGAGIIGLWIAMGIIEISVGQWIPAMMAIVIILLQILLILNGRLLDRSWKLNDEIMESWEKSVTLNREMAGKIAELEAAKTLPHGPERDNINQWKGMRS